ncbi:unnamed protein product, partial [marine sediment metagenome]
GLNSPFLMQRVDRIAKTPSGKIQRHLLRKQETTDGS